MGLKSHTLVNLFLQGKRDIKLRHVDILSKGLKLSSQEALYLKALIQFQNSKTLEEKDLNALWISSLNPGTNFSSKEIDEYRIISDWSYSAILSILDIPDCNGTVGDLYERLQGKVPRSEIEAKILRLKSLGLVKVEKGVLRPTYKKTFTRDDVSNAGVKEYHKQTLSLAQEAIDEVPLDLREFQSYAVSLDSKNIKKLKQLIRQFIGQIDTESQKGIADQVYQLNIQFFQLTQSPSHS